MSSHRSDIAIIGMACIYPGAPDLKKFWCNIINKVDAVSDPPEDWGIEEFYDPASTANDRIYCKKGGFIGDFAKFNPVEFGIMPGSVDGSDPEHFLALQVAREVFADAGYLDRPFNRKRTAVILGHGNYLNRGFVTVLQHGIIVDQVLGVLKALHPETSEADLQAIKQELKGGLPPFTVDTCPGLISNLLTGRIANRLDLQGPNYVVDAACASSLIALDSGINELQNNRCDMAIVGGVTSMNPLIFLVFSLLGALSKRGRIRPFDEDADGTLLGEGIGMMAIKRQEDAERDGDRIYALVKGIGLSSDGKAQAVLVPRLEGEVLALERAYESTGISPETISLIEAHGTATKVGDPTEIQALSRLFGLRNGEFPRCALGAVKSMISHTIPAAGMASLIKSALALYHKTMPPTLCDKPNPDLEIDKTPFYINTETRPWIHGESHPRRVGVSAFGFGGINAHAILEEYNKDNNGKESQSLIYEWDSEVIIVQAESREGLIRSGEQLLRFISSCPEVELKDVAYTLNCPLRDSAMHRLAIVASSINDLEKKLGYTLKRLMDLQCHEIKDRSGIFFFDQPLRREGKIAFLFPGEGSQYINMLSGLCIHFPEVRTWFDGADRVFLSKNRLPLPSQVIFPPPFDLLKDPSIYEKTLWTMDYALIAIYAADLGLNSLLRRLEIQPDMVVGHSTGEEIALLAAEVLKEQNQEFILKLCLDTQIFHQSIEDQIPAAKLMTVGAIDPSVVNAVAADSNGKLYVSMDNCPNQVVLCGSETAIDSAYEVLTKKGAICSFLPFNRAYHTPWYRPICSYIKERVKQLKIQPAQIDLYSCATAQPYPDDLDKMRKVMVEQWALPVRFRETIENMYNAGARIFVEVGARGNLTSFVEDILGSRSYAAVPINVPGQSSIFQFNYAAGLLAAHGVSIKLDYLYARRDPKQLPVYKGDKEDVQEHRDSFKNNKKGALKLEMALPKLILESRPAASTLNVSGRPENPRVNSPDSYDQRNSIRAKVMNEYMHTMEHFLDLQQQSIEAFLEKKSDDRGKGSYEQNLLRTHWLSPVSHIGANNALHASLCRETGNGIQFQELARLVLNQKEHETWRQLRGSEEYRREWLLGRLAAKDAVYLLLKEHYRIELRHTDIEIINNNYGQPAISGELLTKLGCHPCLSIAHSEKTAVAISGECGEEWQGLGIDVEQMGRSHDGLENAGFSSTEQSLLDKVPASEREQWLLRLWCAKEAVGKALGRGMMGTPLNMVIKGMDIETGKVELTIAGQIVREFADYADKKIVAYTGLDEKLVFAVSLV